jgi:secondary thiamine-phosphate synthase enzyme
MTTIEVRTDAREQFVDITDRVAEAVTETRVVTGIAHVFSKHTTAGVTINENADPDVVSDLLSGLGMSAPRHAGWRHTEGNSDAHLKATLVGAGVTVPVSGGRLVLGTWQAVYFCEFDGPRTRHFVVTVVGA